MVEVAPFLKNKRFFFVLPKEDFYWCSRIFKVGAQVLLGQYVSLEVVLYCLCIIILDHPLQVFFLPWLFC